MKVEVRAESAAGCPERIWAEKSPSEVEINKNHH